MIPIPSFQIHQVLLIVNIFEKYIFQYKLQRKLGGNKLSTIFEEKLETEIEKEFHNLIELNKVKQSEYEVSILSIQ